MKKTLYDFTSAVMHIYEWDSPNTMSHELKNAALALSALKDEGGAIKEMQCAALNVCRFLDCIKEIEEEQ